MWKKITILCALGLFCFANAAEAPPLPASDLVQAEQDEAVNRDPKQVIAVSKDHPSFTIRLKSNPTTGYQWYLKGFDSHRFQVMKYKYIGNHNTKLVGAGGEQSWTFSVDPTAFAAPQVISLQLVYGRPWELDKAKIVSFTIVTS